MRREMTMAGKACRMGNLSYGKVRCEQQHPRAFDAARNNIAMWRQASGLTKGQAEMMHTEVSNGGEFPD